MKRLTGLYHAPEAVRERPRHLDNCLTEPLPDWTASGTAKMLAPNVKPNARSQVALFPTRLDAGAIGRTP